MGNLLGSIEGPPRAAPRASARPWRPLTAIRPGRTEVRPPMGPLMRSGRTEVLPAHRVLIIRDSPAIAQILGEQGPVEHDALGLVVGPRREKTPVLGKTPLMSLMLPYDCRCGISSAQQPQTIDNLRSTEMDDEWRDQHLSDVGAIPSQPGSACRNRDIELPVRADRAEQINLAGDRICPARGCHPAGPREGCPQSSAQPTVATAAYRGPALLDRAQRKSSRLPTPRRWSPANP
jgi:hypothetical protein